MTGLFNTTGTPEAGRKGAQTHQHAPELMRGKPSDADASRPALEGPNKQRLPTPTEFAAQEFARRQRAAQGRRDQNIWSRMEAEARLMPWLAIALRAGAEPDAAQPLLEDWRRILSHSCINGGVRTPPSAQTIRNNAAMDLCDRDGWHAELRNAHDAAMCAAMADRANAALGTRWLLFQTLAIFLGVTVTLGDARPQIQKPMQPERTTA